MNKVVLAGLALILARDCDIGGPRFRGQIKGTWGGDNAGLMAFDTTAHVHIGCTAGDTKQALVADEQGRFDAPGRYNFYCATQCSTTELHPKMHGVLIVD